MKASKIFVSLLLLLSLLFVNCGRIGELDTLQLEGKGLLSFQLEAGYDDVAGFLFRVMQGEEIVAEQYVALEEENLPPHLHEGTGSGHRFADAYFVLEPGIYIAYAIPMRAPQEPSEDCLPARKPVEVYESETTEIVLVSRCDMEDNGGLDIIATTNHDPIITDLILRPSKFILTCQELAGLVVAEDPDDDPLFYIWEVTARPEGAIYTLGAEGPHLMFFSHTAGDYELTVKACDPVSEGLMCSQLAFPIHVSMSNDENDNGIGDECELQQAD